MNPSECVDDEVLKEEENYGVRIEENEQASEDYPMFGSSMNLGGGGGPIIQIEEGISNGLLARIRANHSLCYKSAIAGAGMFAESYFLFALGNIKTIWHVLYPECFGKSDPSCSAGLVNSLTYVEVVGVIIGMLSFGYFADKFGRRWGSCSTALLMFIGGLLTTVAYGGQDNLNGLFIFFTVSLFIFSYGVGGEYPLASASAAERAEEARKRHSHMTNHIRGKTVVFTFAMQGWGNWVNSLVIILLILATGTSDCGEQNNSLMCNDKGLEITWRAQYAIGTLFLLILVVGRFLFLKESAVWQESRDKKRNMDDERSSVTTSSTDNSNSMSNTRIAIRQYGSRVFGAASTWFVWDVVFYGNKLFQNTIIGAISGGNQTILDKLLYTLINASVALSGYYAAALVIDKPWMGRARLQNIGFFFTFSLFLICGLEYDWLSQEENIGYFQFLYYLSSFFGQFGPNCTTWLIPSEIVPTQIRTKVHGFSAASGKMGALLATLVFTYAGPGGTMLLPRPIFLICAACGLIGLIISVLFVPDVTQLELIELDKQYEALQRGEESYQGPANSVENLSWFERCINTNAIIQRKREPTNQTEQVMMV